MRHMDHRAQGELMADLAEATLATQTLAQPRYSGSAVSLSAREVDQPADRSGDEVREDQELEPDAQ